MEVTKTTMTADVQMSPQQETVAEWVKTGTGNALVKAVAGSGKTFTLIQIIQLLTGKVAFVAYNKAIQVEIDMKVRALGRLACYAWVSTFHSLAFKSWRGAFPRVQVDGNKVNTLIKYATLAGQLEPGVPFPLRKFVRKAYDLSRQWGIGVLPDFKFGDTQKWMDLVDRFDLESQIENDAIFQGANPVALGILYTEHILKLGYQMARGAVAGINELPVIDFEDMIWCPLHAGMSFETFNWVLVDECQDLNPTRIAMVKAILKPGGRLIAVGDPHQAIYGFTGADAESYKRIQQDFNCVELPLTHSFRCPTSVVMFAQQWVSHIESAPGAPAGMVTSVDYKDWDLSSLTSSDAVLCRNNAPLVTLFFKLLRNGVTSKIEGRDIAMQMIRVCEKWKTNNCATLHTRLIEYAKSETQKAMAQGREERAEQTQDIVSAIIAVMEAIGMDQSVDALIDRINSMFFDSPIDSGSAAGGTYRKMLTLTSIHKSKGREWHRVFWLGRNVTCPSRYARKAWQIEQEDNLCYVAATRAKDTLVDILAASIDQITGRSRSERQEEEEY